MWMVSHFATKAKKKSSGKHSALVLSQLENSQGGIAGQKTLSSFCVTSTKKTTKKKKQRSWADS